MVELEEPQGHRDDEHHGIEVENTHVEWGEEFEHLGKDVPPQTDVGRDLVELDNDSVALVKELKRCRHHKRRQHQYPACRRKQAKSMGVHCFPIAVKRVRQPQERNHQEYGTKRKITGKSHTHHRSGQVSAYHKLVQRLSYR